MLVVVPAFAQEEIPPKPKWNDVENKEDLKLFESALDEWNEKFGGKELERRRKLLKNAIEAQGGKPHKRHNMVGFKPIKKTFKDVVNNIRNRPARRCPETYRNGDDWRGLSSRGGWGNGWRGGGWHGWGHGGWGWGGRYHHASTFAQGYLDGVASVMRAQGQRAESFARAYTQAQEGHRRRILNDALYIEQWFERRKMNREYRAAERMPTPTPEQIKEYAKAPLPDKLSNERLNRETGNINWPDVLKWEMFEEHRDVIAHLYRIRCQGNSQTGVGSSNSRWIEKVGDDFLSLLKDNMDSMSPSEYLYAKNFLKSLIHEAREEK